MISSPWQAFTACFFIALALLASTATGWAGTVQGSATYRERIALPPDAVFEAELQDISRADAPAAVLGRARLEPAGQPPFTFEIAYDNTAMQQGRRYSLRATITHQGRLLFTTDRIYPVSGDRDVPLELLLVSATDPQRSRPPANIIGPLPASYEGELPGASSPIVWHLDLLPENRYQLRLTYVDKPEPNRFDDIGRWTHEPDTGRIVLRGGREAPVFLLPVEDGAALRKLDFHGKPIASGHNDRLERLLQPAPIEPRLLLKGMFTYMADAARITLCADGRSLPVAMEADYKKLETAYRQTVPKPGHPVMASLEGLITLRPSMEESHPPQNTLVVERFIGTWPDETCGSTITDSPLRGTHWKLARLGDSPVAAADKQREAYLIFATHELRVSGSGGCNRVTGSFELDGDSLRLGRMAATMMACPEGMDQEQDFLKSMEKVRGFRIRGRHLEMLDAAGAMIAQFEAVHLR